jgi:hypothetical protein
MRTKSIVIVLTALIALPLAASAADREAKMIDIAAVEFLSYRDMRMPLFTASGELDIFDDSTVAFRLKAGAGVVFYDLSDTPTFWTVAGTFRRRLSPAHSVTFGVAYEAVDNGDAHQVLSGLFGFHARMRPAEHPVSPFFDLHIGLQDAKATDWVTGTDSFIALLLTATLGCDFELRKDVSMVLSASFTDSSDFGESPYGGYADGWCASVGFKYYYY